MWMRQLSTVSSKLAENDFVPIMQEKLVILVARRSFPQLLQEFTQKFSFRSAWKMLTTSQSSHGY